jgi:hypothetical protein
MNQGTHEVPFNEKKTEGRKSPDTVPLSNFKIISILQISIRFLYQCLCYINAALVAPQPARV